MDFQHRPGGKTGSGGVASSSESNRDRRERLRQLALETIDINKVGGARAGSPLGPVFPALPSVRLSVEPRSARPHLVPSAPRPALWALGPGL